MRQRPGRVLQGLAEVGSHFHFLKITLAAVETTDCRGRKMITVNWDDSLVPGTAEYPSVVFDQ